METFSALLALCEGNPSSTGGFLAQIPVARSFGVFVDLRLKKRLNKQSRRRWFETLSRSLWRHYNAAILFRQYKLMTPYVVRDLEHELTHWSRVTQICVSKLTIIGSDNGLLPDRRQAIIWTNAGIFLIGPLGTNFSEILIEILTFSFKWILFKTENFLVKKNDLKISSVKWWPHRLGLNLSADSILGVGSPHNFTFPF